MPRHTSNVGLGLVLVDGRGGDEDEFRLVLCCQWVLDDLFETGLVGVEGDVLVVSW